MKFTEFKKSSFIEDKILGISNHARCVLLDLDGTLFNQDEFIHNRLLVRVSSEFPELSEEEVSRILLHQIERNGTKNIIDFLINQFSGRLAVNDLLSVLRSDEYPIPISCFRPNLIDFLLFMNAQFSLAICTNGNQLQQSVKIRALNSFVGLDIPTIYCADYFPKPNPICLNIAKGDFSPEETIFIGDSKIDEEAAMRAGIAFLNVIEIIE